LQLHAICNYLWLSLGVFTTIRSNFNYFGHFYKYETIIGNFILSIRWFFNLFSSINRLICPIICNSYQISPILKVFYGDLVLYFYVCIKIIFMICKVCICMYIAHIMNLKINNENLNLFFKKNWSQSLYFSSENYYFNSLKNIIWIWNLIFQFENCYFNSLKHNLNLKNIYLNLKRLFDLKIDI